LADTGNVVIVPITYPARHAASLRDETRADYDAGNELLDQAMLAQATLCDEAGKLLP
jgi:hypothetical protein